MTEITLKNAEQVMKDAVTDLQNAAERCETFLELAEICASLRDIAKATLVTSGHEGYEEYDSTTKTNLEVLTEILDASSKLFLTCDEYYR